MSKWQASDWHPFTEEEQRLYNYNGLWDERIEVYARFQHEGDYEKYQPYIFDTDNAEKKNVQRELVRWLWIRSRFCKLAQAEHQHYAELFRLELIKLDN